MRNPENKKLPKHFGVDFFKNVHASIRRSHDTLAYYEKILYNDPKFQSFATEYYWEAEFDKRCRLLKDAILKCPPSKRLSEMPSILSFLDANIGAYAALATRFQNKSETFSEAVVSEGSAQEFLERLSLKLYKLRKKKRVVIGGQKLQAYIFDDLPVIAGGEKTQSLDIIFSRFRQKTSTSENDKASEEKQALLKTYREAYLSSLSKNFKECDFLIQARELDNYLQASTTRYTLEEIKPIIQEISRQYWPGGKFCVSDIRQNQEYHIINVHDWGLFPLATAFSGGWDGMRAGTA